MKLTMLLILLLPLQMLVAQQHYEKSWSVSGAWVWNPGRHAYGLDIKAHYHTTAYHEFRASYLMKREYIKIQSNDLTDEEGRILVPLSSYLLGVAYGHGIKIDPSLNCFILGGVQLGTEVANRSRPELPDGGVIANKLNSFLIGPLLKGEVELVASTRVSLFTSFTQKFLFFSSTGIARIEFQTGLRYYL